MPGQGLGAVADGDDDRAPDPPPARGRRPGRSGRESSASATWSSPTSPSWSSSGTSWRATSRARSSGEISRCLSLAPMAAPGGTESFSGAPRPTADAEIGRRRRRRQPVHRFPGGQPRAQRPARDRGSGQRCHRPAQLRAESGLAGRSASQRGCLAGARGDHPLLRRPVPRPRGEGDHGPAGSQRPPAHPGGSGRRWWREGQSVSPAPHRRRGPGGHAASGPPRPGVVELGRAAGLRRTSVRARARAVLLRRRGQRRRRARGDRAPTRPGLSNHRHHHRPGQRAGEP